MRRECRCNGAGWLPEMCVGRWRCPCSDGYTPNAKNVEAWEHVGQMCAKCDSMQTVTITLKRDDAQWIARAWNWSHPGPQLTALINTQIACREELAK